MSRGASSTDGAPFDPLSGTMYYKTPTDRHFDNWLPSFNAKLDRVGCFKFEPVAGAKANDLPGAVPAAGEQGDMIDLPGTLAAIRLVPGLLGLILFLGMHSARIVAEATAVTSTAVTFTPHGSVCSSITL